MPAVQHIELTEEERQTLSDMLRKGRWSPRQLKRAQILILADKDKDLTNGLIAERLFCDRETVRRVRKRFLSDRLEQALTEGKRQGQPKKLQRSDEKFILMLTSDSCPIGYNFWTLRLLQKRLRERTSKTVSTETIRRFLRNHTKTPSEAR